MTALPTRSDVAPAPTSGPGRRGRGAVVLWATLTLLGSVAALAAIADRALTTAAGQRLDQEAMLAIYGREAAIEQLLRVLGYVSIGTAAVALMLCVGLALARRRYAVAAAAVVVVAAANVTTQLLKHVVLQRPDLGYQSLNSLPSGHTTVVTSIVLAALFVVPTALRTAVVGLGTVAVTFTGASTIAAGWHRPSDVLAALAVCLAWGAAAVLALAARRRGPASHGLLGAGVAALCGSAAAGVLVVALGIRPLGGWTGFGDAAVVLGLVGLASAATVAWFARLASVHAA